MAPVPTSSASSLHRGYFSATVWRGARCKGAPVCENEKALVTVALAVAAASFMQIQEAKPKGRIFVQRTRGADLIVLHGALRIPVPHDGLQSSRPRINTVVLLLHGSRTSSLPIARDSQKHL